MNEPVYFDDGYSRSGYIRAVPGLHGALRFVFRPLLPEERDAFLVQFGKAGELEGCKVAASLLAPRLVSWDLKNGQGLAVPCSPGAFRRLPPRLYQRLVGIITGVDATDPDDSPLGNAPAKDDLKAQAEAILTPATDLQAVAQKN